MSIYQVVGRSAYRGHLPGEIFEARIDGAAERRALARGDIALIDRNVPTLQPGSYTLPHGWTHEHEEKAWQS